MRRAPRALRYVAASMLMLIAARYCAHAHIMSARVEGACAWRAVRVYMPREMVTTRDGAAMSVAVVARDATAYVTFYDCYRCYCDDDNTIRQREREERSNQRMRMNRMLISVRETSICCFARARYARRR